MRYSRQVILPEIGAEGQERLGRTRVLIVGVGGLGSPAVLYLAAAGVGRIGLVDFDAVDESNLQRQVLFTGEDVGLPKVDAAAARLEALNPSVAIDRHRARLDATNAVDLFSRYEMVIDGTDNFEAKFLINDAAARAGIPVVYGSIHRFEGQVSVFWAARGPCYRCLYAEPPRTAIPNCAEAGILGAVAGVIGSMQAAEAIKLAVGAPTLLGRLLVLDALSMTTRTLALSKNPSCPVCSIDPARIEIRDGGPAACAIATADHDWLDVREPHEWDSGHLPGAIHWPLGRIVAGELPPVDPSRECVVYCRSGARSAKAVGILRSRGFPLARNLAGGILHWKGEISRPS